MVKGASTDLFREPIIPSSYPSSSSCLTWGSSVSIPEDQPVINHTCVPHNSILPFTQTQLFLTFDHNISIAPCENVLFQVFVTAQS